MLIGVTDETVEVVDAWFAKMRKKATYPIAILDGQLEKALGVPHFPYSGVLGPDGNIAYAGDNPESTVKDLMRKAKPGSVWPKKLASAADALRAGKLPAAWAEIQELKQKGGLDEPEQATLERFEAYATQSAAAALERGRELVKKDLLWAASQEVEGIAKANPALPASEDCRKLLDELQALPTWKDEVEGGELYAEGQAAEEEREYLDAVNAYKKAIKKAESAKIAAVASARAKELIDKGLPGYAATCPKCSKARKACDKHHKAVKL